ncbi:MAG: hypothetical protein KKF41_12255 [Actinobacteria bacterium]|nr:hypothetical protein [Actinomycetota bacterium]MBU1945078.1 hypothetical protein [Actinomycetota bacterium]MBU2688347.1 hypothetical protein [Actinomycetota bacterium]
MLSVFVAGCGGGAGTRADGATLLYAPSADRASAQNPAFSGDGARVLFTIFHRGYNKGPAGLYVMDLEGASPRTVLFEEGHDSVNLPGSCWNAATDRIAFSSDRTGRHEIWTVSPDGRDPFRVTWHGEATSCLEPTFSPDGKWIMFEVAADSGDALERGGSIWKVRSDGTGAVRLTDGPGGGTDDRQPNWSPDGGRILFQRRAAGSDDWHIFTIAPDGGGLSQVTSGETEDTDASWSPDGGRIVFSSDGSGVDAPVIFVTRSSGGKPRRVTGATGWSDSAPSWSPDGRWIAFESRRGSGEDAPAGLWRARAPAVP